NASVVMGLVPTKGLTLPFLSYGRTSLVVSCFALGVLLGVARRNAQQSTTTREATAWHAAG
ncbi:MAG: FtsW/RodA/SpoVE family cell cycle protein, partial [Deltaproteobacteria bacterium]|nr:FtsW/RodA/SpoVE family cell cycle protein [Deltaproteobacteria bacterium]